MNKTSETKQSNHTKPYALWPMASRSGYTIIELLVVVGLTVILMVTALSIFFTTLTGGGKTASGEYTKQAGEYTMTQITYLLRNARKLVPNNQTPPRTCAQNMTSLGLLGQDGGTTYIFLDQNRIASGSGRFLTPADITVVSGPEFDCLPTDYGTATWDGSAPTIKVSFTLRKGNPSVDKARDIVTLPFESSITLRNY